MQLYPFSPMENTSVAEGGEALKVEVISEAKAINAAACSRSTETSIVRDRSLKKLFSLFPKHAARSAPSSQCFADDASACSSLPEIDDPYF